MVSARKKKEKRKDFVKTKLKVGKEKAKANNHTDTSFVAKSISLPNQSIASAIQGAEGNDGSSSASGLGSEKLAHYLSLFKHHSASTRREAVSYVQNHHVQPIIANSSTTSAGNLGGGSSSNVGNFKSILVAVTPLLTDSAQTVRASSLDLLKTLPAAAIAANASFIALYIHAAMTSIDPSVRAKSTLALEVVLDRAPEPVCRVAWAKLLASFITLLGWTNSRPGSGGATKGGLNSSAMVVTTSLDFGASSSKIAAVHLQSLYKLLAAGVNYGTTKSGQDSSDSDGLEGDGKVENGSSLFMAKFLVPSTSMPYLSLALFGGAKHGGSGSDSSSSTTNVIITEDVESRVELLRKHQDALVNGLDQALKEGGEIGRVAKLIQALVKSQIEGAQD